MTLSKGFVDSMDARKDANFNGWSKQRGVGIFTMMKLLMSLVSSEMMKMLVLQEIKWER